MHLGDIMVMYRVYNAETLENLVNTVHIMHNTTPNEKNYLHETLVLHLHGM